MIPRVLTIAGSDPSGGAGIQADLKTMTALGCYGMSVITALTVQNSRGVSAVHTIPSPLVVDQLKAVLDDITPDSIKMGMVYTPETIKGIARLLRGRSLPLILDPVMVSSSGKPLLERYALNALQEELFPLAALVTPNIQEAGMLLGVTIGNEDDQDHCARQLADKWTVPFLLKGGDLHGSSLCTDLLAHPGRSETARFLSPRVESGNTHGTGCTLSSGIACFRGLGFPLNQAVLKAKEYTLGALQSALSRKWGSGIGAVNHMWKFTEGAVNG